MKNLIQLLAVCMIPFLLNSCSASKRASQLNFHNDVLTKAAASNMSATDKVDAIGVSFVKMMDEAMSIKNPKKGVDYVKKYVDQNDSSLNSIWNSLEKSQKDMNVVERVNYAAGLLKKPYAKDLVRLVPKFTKRFKQIEFIARLVGKMKGGIGGAIFKGIGKNLLGNSPAPQPEPCPAP